ncbi:MAG: PAS domain-containing protein, partial [Hymenobacter sp.]
MSLHSASAAPADDTSPAELLASLHTLASLSEQNPNPIVRLDSTGRQLYANPAALALRQGLSRAEQVAVRQQLRAALGQDIQGLEIRVGQRYFLLQKAAIVPPEGSITLYLAETTARVQVERQLADQQALMSQILDATPTPICVRDAQHHLVFENRATTQLRYRSGYLHPDPDAVQQPTPRQAAEWQTYVDADKRVLVTGESFTGETSTTLASGEVRYFCTNRRLLVRPDGTRQVLIVGNDITEEKLAADALARREKQYRDLMMHSQALIC